MTARQDPSAAMLDTFQSLDKRLAVLGTALADQNRGKVLLCESFMWPANGVKTFDFQVPYQAVSVYNTDFETWIWATSSPPTSDRDGIALEGPGLVVIPPARGLVFNMSGYSLTLFGWVDVPASPCTVQVFSTPQPPNGWS